MSTEAVAHATAPRIDADNPWPGLLSFSEQDATYFKGRDHETDDLLRLVMRERLTVLFGISGLGKSSLLQAGLFPRLRPENLFPVYLRLDYSGQRPDLVGQVLHTIAREARRIGNLPDKHRVEAPAAQEGEKLWEYFHRTGNNFWNERNRPLMPVLVFDQFEEIFTLGRQDADRKAASAAFLEQLADLAEGRPPTALKSWIDDYPDQASAYDFGRHFYKVLLGIREDYLPDLETLRARMPRIALNRLRLRRMNGEAALLVVNQAKNLIDGDVAEKVVRFVAADEQSELRELQIEPALLSVFCSELNNKRKDFQQPKITLELLQGSQQQVIANFYERSTSDLAPEVRTFIEDHLLTVSGYRDSVALENALGMGLSQETVKKLIDRRLVRQEDRGGSKRLELTHDLLVSVVRASRDKRRQREAAEKEKAALLAEQEKQKQAILRAQEEERERLEKAQEAERRERDRLEMKRLRLRSFIAYTFATLAVASAIWAFEAEQQAKRAEQQARKESQENQAYATEVINRASRSIEDLAGTVPIETSKPPNGAEYEAKRSVQLPQTMPPPPPPAPKPVEAGGSASTPVAGQPRVFIQIVNQADKAFATQLTSKFQASGFSVQPIQYVPQAAVLSRTDVRYYRQSDAATAQKIVDLLKAAGQSSARAYIPSGMENNPNVRPNTFEVWLANSSGSGTTSGNF